MANPSGHVVLGEEGARAMEECYVTLEEELQVLRARNEELTCGLQVQQEIVVAAKLQGNRRA